jgi:hypothetical protein
MRSAYAPCELRLPHSSTENTVLRDVSSGAAQRDVLGIGADEAFAPPFAPQRINCLSLPRPVGMCNGFGDHDSGYTENGTVVFGTLALAAPGFSSSQCATCQRVVPSGL